MQIAANTVVSLNYTLKDDAGNIIDQSQPGAPLVYLQGHGNIIPGLEKALEGKALGEALDVRIDAAEGYGEPNPALTQVVPRDRFQGIDELAVGMQFQAGTEQGPPIAVRITAIEGDSVTVDGNHPLAGMALNFSVSIADLREATEEEIAHGHIHQGGGCCGGGGHDHDHNHSGGCGCS
ncbi:peptidylprolyl isomerase [Cerasicoccus maritimus]|uniref:peptidylprolyl isomerase n=1 Tax=Cerasicoccus maritimus TaxID=490089 RepID=UPI0028527E2C|nr:peptidylprolyl isomerase [Cerasicoccus maritimus]